MKRGKKQKKCTKHRKASLVFMKNYFLFSLLFIIALMTGCEVHPPSSGIKYDSADLSGWQIVYDGIAKDYPLLVLDDSLSGKASKNVYLLIFAKNKDEKNFIAIRYDNHSNIKSLVIDNETARNEFVKTVKDIEDNGWRLLRREFSDDGKRYMYILEWINSEEKGSAFYFEYFICSEIYSYRFTGFSKEDRFINDAEILKIIDSIDGRGLEYFKIKRKRKGG